MPTQYAFYFDSNSCSGCKACQVACKDKHGLEVGRLWRRVYEVSGGGWHKDGMAWRSDAYAYNLSIACNHCERPACVEACPAQALNKRTDGIVLVDAERCLGCKYCAWACPYGALQYDSAARCMTKCTFCFDNLEAGLPPACVAACPLRVLDFGEAGDLKARYAAHGHALVPAVAPMPGKEWTQPNLLIHPHNAAAHVRQRPAHIANLEEVHTAPPGDERPLVFFTLLAQMAVGAFITLGGFALPLAAYAARLPVFGVGLVMLAALLASLLHLGSPQRAYRAIANWRTSWLSREILSAGAFAGGLALFNLLQWLDAPSSLRAAVFWLTALAGLGLVFSITRVYSLRTIPEWSTWRTTAAFLASAALLGPLLAGTLLFLERGTIDFGFILGFDSRLLHSIGRIMLGAACAAGIQIFLTWLERPPASAERHTRRLFALRLAYYLLICAITCTCLAVQFRGLAWHQTGSALLLAFGFALAAEFIGRSMFYDKKIKGL